MRRFLLPAVVMVGALVVLSAGTLGNLQSLPNLTAEFPALFASFMPERASTRAPDFLSSSRPTARPSDAVQQLPPGTQQPLGATDALQRQLAELQGQIAERSKELIALRSNADDAHSQLDTLRQQRQAEEAAIARLQSQQGQAADLQARIDQRSQELASLRTSEEQARREFDELQQQRVAEDTAARQRAQQRQLAVAKPSNPPPIQPRPLQQASDPGSASPRSNVTQTAVAQLRAKEPASQRPSQQPAPSTSMPMQRATQPVLIVSPRGVLITARELLASGRSADARQLLMKVQAQTALRPVTADQPLTSGGSVAAAQIGDAIRFLDAGNTGSALQAINVAMDSTSGTAPAWSTYPQAQGR